MSVIYENIGASLKEIGTAPGVISVETANPRNVFRFLKKYARNNGRRLFSCIFGDDEAERDRLMITADYGSIVIMDERFCGVLSEKERYNLLGRMIEEKGCLIILIFGASKEIKADISIKVRVNLSTDESIA